ncbi:MAG: YggS family pyridoxal phosphate enzyme [Bacteroidetes bacterium GWE2_29_8]|nr:MAG: YggS family pyridoxal phosphate enzyme [Bacteroidetes bacterium GWE2_29_8]OFY24369.1 MAG: YggS family pyridoxal phosphate enzyme [Bacteroidetes bacterium GWF2_29_10]
MSIEQNYNLIKRDIPQNVKLIVVSKYQSVQSIQSLYNIGNKCFGENRIQELIEKKDKLPLDIEWHLIGHLQTNKVKYIAPFVSYIHSIDSLKLLIEVNKEALKNDRIIKCLLQFHIAKEDTKFGLDLDESKKIINTEEFKSLKNINIVGVMGMATFTSDNNVIVGEFKDLKNIFDYLKTDFFNDKLEFKEISMGMSSDYKIAIEYGATMIRVGSAIFK